MESPQANCPAHGDDGWSQARHVSWTLGVGVVWAWQQQLETSLIFLSMGKSYLGLGHLSYPSFLPEFESSQIFPSFFFHLRFPLFSCAALQVAPLLYVLHHGALHVAFQHLHHSHGDANRGGSAPGASECWGGVRGHHDCRQHRCRRKQANRYLSVLTTLFSFIYQWPDLLTHIIQLLSRSDLSDLYCQNHWYVLFLFVL